MASNKQKKANIKKGLLGRATGETNPVIVQDNNVIRVEKELDQSREAKKRRKAASDAKTTQPTSKKKK